MCSSCGCRALARSKVYQFLSLGFLYPDSPTLEALADSLPQVELALRLLDDLETRESLNALLVSAWGPSAWQEEYLRVFGQAISKECPPYETEYDQAHIFQKAQALADIAGFYTAFGLQLSSTFKDRPDHLSTELEFMHFLTLKELHALAGGQPQDRIEMCRDAQRKFLGDHLYPWVPEFVTRLKEKAGPGTYRLWGQLATAFLSAEMGLLGLKNSVQVAGLNNDEAVSEEEEDEAACPVLPIEGGALS